MKKNKLKAIVLVAFMLIGILFSYYLMMEESHHDCVGENCPICKEIEQAIQFITHIEHLPSLLGVIVVPCLFLLLRRTVKKQKGKIQTLITLKVELLN